MKRLHLVIKGEVQGVFFRDYVNKSANFLKIKGWVKNNSDGTMEVVAEGSEDKLKELLEKCMQGPQSAKVDKIEENWEKATNEFDSFEIRY